MRVVGIRQLKARLSEYLREVRRGETFLVTDRDEVVAELGPPGRDAPSAVGGIKRVLGSMAAAWEIAPARLAKGKWSWSPQGAGLSPGAAARLLEELGSERSAEEG